MNLSPSSSNCPWSYIQLLCAGPLNSSLITLQRTDIGKHHHHATQATIPDFIEKRTTTIKKNFCFIFFFPFPFIHAHNLITQYKLRDQILAELNISINVYKK